jgi:hypothetical protein
MIIICINLQSSSLIFEWNKKQFDFLLEIGNRKCHQCNKYMAPIWFTLWSTVSSAHFGTLKHPSRHTSVLVPKGADDSA